MTDVIPQREGKSLAARPTEWLSAISGIVAAVTAYFQAPPEVRDEATLILAVAGFVPAIITALVAWWEKRHPEGVTVVPAKVDE